MATKIRLKRIGRRNRPFYRVIITDSRNRRDGAAIEEIGWFNPLEKSNNYVMDQERILHWLKLGAQPSKAIRNLMKHSGLSFRWHLIRQGLDEKSIEKEIKKRQLNREDILKQRDLTKKEKKKTEAAVETAEKKETEEKAGETAAEEKKEAEIKAESAEEKVEEPEAAEVKAESAKEKVEEPEAADQKQVQSKIAPESDQKAKAEKKSAKTAPKKKDESKSSQEKKEDPEKGPKSETEKVDKKAETGQQAIPEDDPEKA